MIATRARTRLRQLLATGGLAVVVVLGTAGPGHAATTVEAGWWTASPLPVAPDAPSDALVVEGGIVGPLAYGAIRLTLAPDEVPRSLILRVAPEAASTPSTTLALCPLTETFTPAQGGPMADAPAFDCATTVEAAPSADGTSYEFEVADLRGGGSLAVAVLPTAPTDRVVLSAPGTYSLTSSRTGTGSGGTGTPAARPATDADVAIPSPPVASGAVGPAPPRPVAGPPAVPSSAPPAPAVASPPAATPSVAPIPLSRDRGPDERSWLPPAALVGLAAVAALLWLRSGAEPDQTQLSWGVLPAQQPVPPLVPSPPGGRSAPPS